MKKANKEILKAAFRLDANLSDRDIRMIRANSMGVYVYEYEKTFREIGRDNF